MTGRRGYGSERRRQHDDEDIRYARIHTRLVSPGRNGPFGNRPRCIDANHRDRGDDGDRVLVSAITSLTDAMLDWSE